MPKVTTEQPCEVCGYTSHHQFCDACAELIVMLHTAAEKAKMLAQTVLLDKHELAERLMGRAN